MLAVVLLVLILLSSTAAIVAESARPRRTRLVYVFKPLTTLLIFALAAVLPAPDSVVRTAILLGLGLSLAGDVFLMSPGDRFLPGLVAFLLAHLAYLAAFTRHVPLATLPLPFLVVGALGAAVASILWGGVPPRTRLAVLAYVVVLGTMTAQAISQGLVLTIPPAWAGAAGGALFFVSDSALAYDRFRRPFRWARAVILASYWMAQTLIAFSVAIPLA